MPLTHEQVQIIKTALSSVVENEPMANHTNFRIGGPARLFVVARSSDELVTAVRTAIQTEIPWYVFGGGSNLLVADSGFDGLMIQAGNRGLAIEGVRATCEAGAMMSYIARKTAEAGLKNFEWAAGIPGTIGGAVYGNAGCYGSEVGDAVRSVEAFRTNDGQRVVYSKEACAFGYRDSLFKHEPHVILGCTLELHPGNAASVVAEIERIVAERAKHQPLGTSSAGCMFKNFEFSDIKTIDKLQREVDVPQDMIDAQRIPAGWLLERAGLKGYEFGGIGVSKKHANFVVNNGSGTADQVAQLVSLCNMKVRDHFGISLQIEVQYVGFG